MAVARVNAAADLPAANTEYHSVMAAMSILELRAAAGFGVYLARTARVAPRA